MDVGKKLPKTKIDVYVDSLNWYHLIERLSKNNYKSISQTINTILTEYFKQVDENRIATDRLNKVIQSYELKVLNLEHELRLLKGVSNEK